MREMEKKLFHLTAAHDAWLRRVSEITLVSQAEILRALIAQCIVDTRDLSPDQIKCYIERLVSSDDTR